MNVIALFTDDNVFWGSRVTVLLFYSNYYLFLWADLKVFLILLAKNMLILNIGENILQYLKLIITYKVL